MSESVNPPNGERQAVRQRRLPYPMLAGSLAITAIAVAGAVFAAPRDFRVPLAVGASAAALMLTAALTMAAYYRGRVN